jgi:hypothetical protein
MRRCLGVLVLAAALLGGCASQPVAQAASAEAAVTTPTPTRASTPTPAPTPAPTASPSPTAISSPPPAPPTIAQAATAFLAIATPYNKAIIAAYNKYGKTLTLKSQKAYLAAVATAEAAFIAGFKKIAFPPEVTGKAAALLDADVVKQRWTLAASKSTTWASFDANASGAHQADGIAADKAAILRDALGLPSN